MAEVMTREAAQGRLVEKAVSDAAFRASLLADPRKVIAAELGIPIPSGITIEVLEETPAHFYVVLPASGDALTEGDLDDEALEAVAGGEFKLPLGSLIGDPISSLLPRP